MDSSLSRDSIRGLPLPPSCLLPVGHTAALSRQPERAFSQIANANYNPVFWAISLFLFIILTCGLSLYFGFLSVLLTVVEFVVSNPPFLF